MRSRLLDINTFVIALAQTVENQQIPPLRYAPVGMTHHGGRLESQETEEGVDGNELQLQWGAVVLLESRPKLRNRRRCR